MMQQDLIKQKIDVFLNYLKFQKHASENTVKSYQRDLLRLETYLSSNKLNTLEEITRQDIQSHISSRHEDGITATSLQRELSAIRSFFNFLIQTEILTDSPVSKIKIPKKPRKLPKPVAVDALNALLDKQPDTVLEIRDHAMWEILYSSGLRLSELVGLDLEDIDLAQNQLLVRKGKGNKSRLVPLGSKACASIDKWLAHRNSLCSFEEKALFVSRKGNRISNRNVQARLNHWGLKQGADEHIHPHRLRHSFASHMLESSGELRAIQEMLGHANLSTTQIYTQIDFQHLATTYDKTHPRARKKKE